MQRAKRPVLAGVLATSLMITAMMPVTVQAFERRPGEGASEMAVLGDVLIGRPALAAVSATGLVAFTLTLPFSALGHNVDEMAEKLVRAPSRATFLRCLGCTPAQHQRRQIERRTKAKR